MTKFRQCESERLTELTTLAREAKKLNSQYLDQLAGILRLAEICRKYETEKEKVCTVYDLDRLNSMNEMEVNFFFGPSSVLEVPNPSKFSEWR